MPPAVYSHNPNIYNSLSYIIIIYFFPKRPRIISAILMVPNTGTGVQKTFNYSVLIFLTKAKRQNARAYRILTPSVQFSCSVVSDSLRPHESQHDRPPCPSPTPRVHSDSSPSNQWCHPAISSSVIPFSSCPQSLPALESFPMSQLFPWGGQSTGVSALASFLPKKSQGWSSEWTGWISL